MSTITRTLRNLRKVGIKVCLSSPPFLTLPANTRSQDYIVQMVVCIPFAENLHDPDSND
jgi:hypothetical protein